MANLRELKTHVSRAKSTAADRGKSTSIDTTQPFCRLAEGGRIIRSYSGFCPYTRLSARHILRCEHLRDIPGERLPYRAELNYTHQLWIWYKLNKEPDKLYLLFRGQFDLTIHDINPDWIAREVSDFLAYLLINSKDHIREVFRHQNSEIFWTLAIEKKLKSLLF